MNCGKPVMSADDIISLQLEALGKYPEKGDLETVYHYFSPRKKGEIGNYSDFKTMFQTAYPGLLGLTSWNFDGNPKFKNNNTKYKQRVKIVNGKSTYVYQFELSRQFDYRQNQTVYDPYSEMCLNEYWRTDQIILISHTQGKRHHRFPVPEKFIGKTTKKGGKKQGRDNDKNILGSDLEICSLSPRTGFYRDGYCRTGPSDHGTHTVCAQVTDRFLNFSKNRGNNLIDPSPQNNFPGLKDGDYWCLCASRYQEALDNGIRMKVNKQATHPKTRKYVKKRDL